MPRWWILRGRAHGGVPRCALRSRVADARSGAAVSRRLLRAGAATRRLPRAGAATRRLPRVGGANRCLLRVRVSDAYAGCMLESSRGVLYPSRLPSFHRLAPPPEVAHLVTWFWIPQWQLPPDESSRQDIVAYPALNLVVDPTQVTLAGATTRASHRELRGHGWAVGALLRPAAVAALVDAPAGLVDTEFVMDPPDLHGAIAAAMVPEGSEREHSATAAGSSLVAAGQVRRDQAVAHFSAWLLTRVGSPPTADLHANGLTEIFMGDDFARSVAEAAERLAVSSRTLQRIAHRYVGLPPAAMIRRRRLQEAADRVRRDPTLDLAALANELGYADHAHLTRDFTLVLGMAPTTYRKSSR